MAKKQNTTEKIVNHDLTKKALAKAVCDGDIVNFRLLFMPFSPARRDSTERFETEKYAYLLPDETLEREPDFRKAMDLVCDSGTWGHIEQELQADRPPQLPSELLLPLADHAVAAGKYTIAAQAYEMLRIRPRMQEELLAQADLLLEQSSDSATLRKAVHGYIAASGLAYDYAAFPEPLPRVPDYQTRALMLHGEYPEKPEDCIGLQETETLLRTAFDYLLFDPEVAARLEKRPVPVRVAFLKELVNQGDSEWRAFVHQYHEACRFAKDFQKRFDAAAQSAAQSGAKLAQEIARELGDDPQRIPAALLGREIENGQWWQYLKELAFRHPAAVLFIARQLVGDVEILVPRFRADCPIPRELGLTAGLNAE